MSSNLMNIRVSNDGRFVLGEKFNKNTFTEDLYLVDLLTSTVHKLTYTPVKRIFQSGKASGKYGHYGFSPDSRFAVITFPNGVYIVSKDDTPPLISKDVKHKTQTLAFLDLDTVSISESLVSITLIQASGFPVFSPSGHRFMVPVNRNGGESIKSMVYEISQGRQGKTVFSGYELPYRDIHQGSFITENRLYIFNGNELIMYDIVGARVNRIRDFSEFDLKGSGYRPPQMPQTEDFSNGLVALKGDYYAYIVTDTNRLQTEGQTSETNNKRIPDDQNLSIIRGNCNNQTIDYIQIPGLPESKYRDYFLYHYIYLPDQTDDIAVLVSAGWRNTVFRIVNFQNRTVSELHWGFFMGMSRDAKGVIYVKTCDKNSTPHRNNSNYIYSSMTIGGKTTSVRTNRLYYRNLETGIEKVLIDGIGHISEAFFLR